MTTISRDSLLRRIRNVESTVKGFADDGSSPLFGLVTSKQLQDVLRDAREALEGPVFADGPVPAETNAEGLEPFQDRVLPWMLACFGPEILADSRERCHRFLEEALELVQSLGVTADEAHQLVDYTFGRPRGETRQEIGGVMVTLAALCSVVKEDLRMAGETELDRVWTKMDRIREKHTSRPHRSPLPGQAGAENDFNSLDRYTRWLARDGLLAVGSVEQCFTRLGLDLAERAPISASLANRTSQHLATILALWKPTCDIQKPLSDNVPEWSDEG